MTAAVSVKRLAVNSRPHGRWAMILSPKDRQPTTAALLEIAATRFLRSVGEKRKGGSVSPLRVSRCESQSVSSRCGQRSRDLPAAQTSRRACLIERRAHLFLQHFQQRGRSQINHPILKAAGDGEVLSK